MHFNSDDLELGNRSLDRSTRTAFRRSCLSAGAYAVRACSLNEEGACGTGSPLSNQVVID